MIEKQFETEFYDILNKNQKFVKYMGMIDYNNSVKVISKYDLLLLPTKYYTEGIPGTIIDSYAAGVPVLASSWENYKDIILDKKTGLVFNFNDLNDFKEKLNYVYDNQKEIYDMKKECINNAKIYCNSEALNPLFDALDRS